MRYARNGLVALFILPVAFLLASCATKVVGLQHDPTYNYNSIQFNHLAVGGVTSAVGSFEDRYDLRDEATSMLRLQMIREREDIFVQPVGVVRNALGEEEFEEMLDVYQRGGELSEEQLGNLHDAMESKARYVVFARIEADQLRHRRKESTEGKEEDQHIVLEMIASRTLTVEFQVYDVSESKSVWRGLIIKSRSNKNKYVYEIAAEDDEDFLEVIVGVILENTLNKPEYPAAPEQGMLLAAACKGFAENLPKSKDK